jgi:hypothetical protein
VEGHAEWSVRLQMKRVSEEGLRLFFCHTACLHVMAVVVNRNGRLAETVEQIGAIMEAERLRVSRCMKGESSPRLAAVSGRSVEAIVEPER